MGIMKLSNVPELTEFAGTEKIYVNDNGETKQISCDKVVTGNGGGVFIIDDGADNFYELGDSILEAFIRGDKIYLFDSYRDMYSEVITLHSWISSGHYYITIYFYGYAGSGMGINSRELEVSKLP